MSDLDPALLAPERARRIRRSEYDQMVALGLFGDERLELLHGVIVEMSPNDPPHASPVQRLTRLLLPPLLDRAEVRIQLPLVAVDESEPEPDVAVVPRGDYADAHPDRAFLVIEVAHSSLRKDRLLKGPLYAASGVLEYWIVDVRERLVEVHRGPGPAGWSRITRHGLGEALALQAFPDVILAIDAFLR